MCVPCTGVRMGTGQEIPRHRRRACGRIAIEYAYCVFYLTYGRLSLTLVVSLVMVGATIELCSCSCQWCPPLFLFLPLPFLSPSLAIFPSFCSHCPLFTHHIRILSFPIHKANEHSTTSTSYRLYTPWQIWYAPGGLHAWTWWESGLSG
ncbi:hypothetical protein BDQ17DRAFT_1375874 [Cyathus striatus]|nr:hypothetical protein BDQ17DRAFT_1375874 [Cyathus striatus]